MVYNGQSPSKMDDVPGGTPMSKRKPSYLLASYFMSHILAVIVSSPWDVTWFTFSHPKNPMESKSIWNGSRKPSGSSICDPFWGCDRCDLWWPLKGSACDLVDWLMLEFWSLWRTGWMKNGWVGHPSIFVAGCTTQFASQFRIVNKISS